MDKTLILTTSTKKLGFFHILKEFIIPYGDAMRFYLRLSGQLMEYINNNNNEEEKMIDNDDDKCSLTCNSLLSLSSTLASTSSNQSALLTIKSIICILIYIVIHQLYIFVKYIKNYNDQAYYDQIQIHANLSFLLFQHDPSMNMIVIAFASMAFMFIYYLYLKTNLIINYLYKILLSIDHDGDEDKFLDATTGFAIMHTYRGISVSVLIKYVNDRICRINRSNSTVASK